jgi:hypothetical protein
METPQTVTTVRELNHGLRYVARGVDLACTDTDASYYVSRKMATYRTTELVADTPAPPGPVVIAPAPAPVHAPPGPPAEPAEQKQGDTDMAKDKDKDKDGHDLPAQTAPEAVAVIADAAQSSLLAGDAEAPDDDGTSKTTSRRSSTRRTTPPPAPTE